ncbi:hypothetical protein NDU88_004651 [Pleurodeles waltl]|uniref:Uncharacterized protein n=1 Tax=Pleurodeles waltl TaxID=8319 RepID=A0AAV7L0W4_PLEWA|nr:hypothetical protein NDU88_004651 [Pleurodeles waltl]
MRPGHGGPPMTRRGRTARHRKGRPVLSPPTWSRWRERALGCPSPRDSRTGRTRRAIPPAPALACPVCRGAGKHPGTPTNALPVVRRLRVGRLPVDFGAAGLQADCPTRSLCYVHCGIVPAHLSPKRRPRRVGRALTLRCSRRHPCHPGACDGRCSVRRLAISGSAAPFTMALGARTLAVHPGRHLGSSPSEALKHTYQSNPVGDLSGHHFRFGPLQPGQVLVSWCKLQLPQYPWKCYEVPGEPRTIAVVHVLALT